MKKRLLSCTLVLTLFLGLSPAFAADVAAAFPAQNAYLGFADVAETDSNWYYSPVKVCVETGLMNGTGSGFAPDSKMTLGEVAAIAARVGAAITGKALPAATTPWYQGYLTYLEQNYQITGLSPAASAARGDFFALLSKVVPTDHLTAKNSITSLPDTADAGVLLFYNAGILTGTDAYGTFHGEGALSRAEAAAMLARIIRPELRKRFVPAVRIAPKLPEDVILATAGIPRDTVLLTVDGNPVTAEAYLYWFISYADTLSAQLGGQIDWEKPLGNTPVKDLILTNATHTAAFYQLVETHAKELGFALTAADKAAYERELAATKKAYAAQTGSADEELAYLQHLAYNGLSHQGLTRLSEASLLFQKTGEGLFAASGKEPPTPARMAAWAEETGTLRAKHILLTSDSTATAAEALKKATAIRAELKAAGDTEAKFDALMAQHSGDVGPNGTQNCGPDGYTFGVGEMVLSFETGTQALKVGQVSDPIQSEFGYHIILRLDPNIEANHAAYTTAKTNALADQWVKNATMKATPALDRLDVEAFYKNLLALRAEITG